MAALPYMQFYVADYLADTMHLSTEEHGAYLLLIFNYWQTGKPLPKNRLAGIARLSNERWTDVERSLNEFLLTMEMHGFTNELSVICSLLKVLNRSAVKQENICAETIGEKTKEIKVNPTTVQRALNEMATTVQRI
jgi:Uncharacterized protein conserved in bacteria